MSQISTHVLDTALGRPAAGVSVVLKNVDGELLGDGFTDADGRVAHLGPDSLPPGSYRLVFITGPYFEAASQPVFFPQVTIDFQVTDPTEHHHVPLLLSPFAYSTYRGS